MTELLRTVWITSMTFPVFHHSSYSWYLYLIVIYIYIYIYIYINVYIYIHLIYSTVYEEKHWLKHSIYPLVLPRGFFRVEKFTDLLLFVNYVYNWEILCHINDFFKQFLVPVKKVCIPSFQQKMMVKELLNIVKSFFQNHLGNLFLVSESNIYKYMMNRGNKSARWNDKLVLEVWWYLYNRADTLKSDWN